MKIREFVGGADSGDKTTLGGSSSNTMDSEVNTRAFTGWVIVSQLLGLTAVILVAVWTGHYMGGFAWSENPSLQFNYHPLFMIIGFIFLYADSILVYRVFRNERKRRTKLLHAAIHAVTFIFVVVALKAVFDSHDLAKPKPIPNLYSLHSWIGLITVILFVGQYVISFITFLAPGLSLSFRQFVMPLHRYMGVGIFAMACVAVISGLNEKAFFVMPGGEYGKKGGQAILVNILGLVVILQGLVVGYVVSNINWRRQPLPEEEQFTLGSATSEE